MAEREIRVKFSGDTRGLSAAMRDAQRMYQEAQTRAAVLSRQVEDADARIAATQQQRAATTNGALKQLADQRAASQQRERTQFAAEYDKAVRAAEDAEKRLTRTAGEEGRKRTQATEQETRKQIDLSGLVNFGKYAAVAGAGVAAVSIRSQMDLARDLRTIQREAGATRDQAAGLAAVMTILGIPVESLSNAFRTLSGSMANSPDDFKKLGIALKDADGASRPVIDVFMDLRRLMAGSAKDATFYADAQRLMGRGYQDLLPLMEATEDEITALIKAGATLGIVLTQEAQQGVEGLEDAMTGAQVAGQSLAQHLTQTMVPAIAQVATWAAQAADMLGAMLKPRPGVQQGEFLRSGFRNLWLNTIDIIRGEDPTGRLAEIFKEVTDAQGARDALTTIRNRQRREAGQRGPGPSLPPLGAVDQAAADAAKRAQVELIRGQIDAIREVSDARIDALRMALEADDKLRASQIETAQVTRRMTAQVYQSRIEAIREEQSALDRLTRDRLQAINDELAARQALREAETKGLQDQLAALDQSDQAQKDAAALAEATAAIEEERTKDMRRVRSESLEDYRQRVTQHNDELRRLEENLARIQTDQAKRAARESLQARIDAISQSGAADQAATQTQVQRIQREQQARRDRSEDEIAMLGKEAKARDQAFEGAIAQLEALRTASKVTADQQIADVQRYTNEWLRNLQKQINAIEGRPEAVTPPGFALPSGGGAVFAPVPGGGLPSQTGTFGGVALTSTTQDFFRSIGMAHGGSLLLREPAALFGLNSGRALAVGGEAGIEQVSFGSPRGARQSLTVLTINGREFARAIGRDEFRDFRGQGGVDG